MAGYLFWRDDLAHKVQDDHLVFEIKEKDTYVYFFNTEFTYSDVRLDTEVKNIGVNMNSVGMTCRQSNLGWYEFNVGADGFYEIYLYDALKNGFTLLYNGGSTAINTGQATNHFTAICAGDQLSLYINGVHTRTVTNNFLTRGHVGLSASSYRNVPVSIWFDWLETSQP